MKQKIFNLLLAIFIMSTAFCMNANAATAPDATDVKAKIEFAGFPSYGADTAEVEFIDAGYCGNNVMWGLTTDGILYIVGEGKGTMANYEGAYRNLAPWNKYKSSIYAVYVDENVTNIGDCAFYECDQLLYAYIENGVKTLGSCAFYFCKNLEEVELPQTLTKIGSSAFAECKNLVSIQIPNSVTSIGSSAFSQCDALTTANLPPNITVIEYDTFYGCENLRNISIPKKVTQIGPYAFIGCESFTSLTIPGSVKSIGTRAFSYCHNLKTVNFSSGLTTIGDDAFIYDYALEKVVLPNTVKNLGTCIFEECTSLKEVVLPQSITVIPKNMFTLCTNLSKVTFPANLKTIDSGAFADCKSLTTLAFPSYLETIHTAAFIRCENLTTVRIPAKVNYINTNAFAYCPKLHAVSILNPNIGFGSTVFSNDNNVLIRCIENSTAQTYATRNGHAYELIDLSIVTEYFDDVYQDWYTGYVQYAYDNNLMTGIKGVSRFEPNANITKAQVAQVLYNMETEIPEPTDLSVFTELTDVYAAEWYANAIAWAYSNSIVTGDLNTRQFYPNANVTREQLALMLYRYAQYKEYDVSAAGDFSDYKNAENVSNWAAEGMRWTVGAGLISGIEKDGVKDLAPQGNATRAQMAAILQRFCENKK